MDECVWFELAEISESLLESQGLKPFDVVHLFLPDDDDDEHGELTSCVLQVVPRSSSDNDNKVLLHPTLFQCLSQAALLKSNGEKETHEDVNVVSETDRLCIGPLPSLPSFASLDETQTKDSHHLWSLRKVAKKDLPAGTVIDLKCLYIELDRSEETKNLNSILAEALEGRWIMKGTTILLSTIMKGIILATIALEENMGLDAQVAYRLGTCDTYAVKTTPIAVRHTTAGIEDDRYDMVAEWERNCPGYETLVKEVVQLMQLKGPASPSGLLLTGTEGVGKSRLASCVASRLKLDGGWNIQWVSLQDLVLRASWATEDNMFELLIPSVMNDSTAIVVDDLDLLITEDSLDNERRLVLNSLLQAVDRLVEQDATVLGIAQSSLRLPAELLKIGRLEKEICMEQPTQVQRELVLSHLLEESRCDRIDSQKWAELLTPMTAGCVAVDLYRICADAWFRTQARTVGEGAFPSWEDLREAARTCIPSQLATFDVTKPRSFADECSSTDWLRLHELSWMSFAGNDKLKKGVYRAVIVPWRRHLSIDGPRGPTASSQISPPSGVLFHGASGTGKSLASFCLGSSLGLPMIKVRAADVLDMWVGGSEAVIRSLFARARASAPCILFFDEIDAIAGNRARHGDTSDVMTRLLSTLLNEMDGVSSGRRDNVLVVACTNRLETLDAALLRPGRLEEHFELTMPESHDAQEILTHYVSKAPLHETVDLGAIAEELSSRQASCADIEGVVREAMLRSMRRSTDYSNVSVSISDFREAINALKL